MTPTEREVNLLGWPRVIEARDAEIALLQEQVETLTRERTFWEDRENKAILRAEAAEAERDRLREALIEARGHAADFAATGMLMGDDQAETYCRVQEKGKALLKIIQVALQKEPQP